MLNVLNSTKNVCHFMCEPLFRVVVHLAAALWRLTNAAGTFGAWKIGVWDKWRLTHLAAGTFPVWHLAFQTIGAWIFGARDISRPRHLASGKLALETYGAQKISRPYFWRLGHLALSRRPIIQDILCPDFWRSGHFPPRLLAVRTFDALENCHFQGHLANLTK